MYILASFTKNNELATGLSPTLSVIDVETGNYIQENVLMIELQDGFYKYNFNANFNSEYVYIAKGNDQDLDNLYCIGLTFTGSIQKDTIDKVNTTVKKVLNVMVKDDKKYWKYK